MVLLIYQYLFLLFKLCNRTVLLILKVATLIQVKSHVQAILRFANWKTGILYYVGEARWMVKSWWKIVNIYNLSYIKLEKKKPVNLTARKHNVFRVSNLWFSILERLKCCWTVDEELGFAIDAKVNVIGSRVII